MKFCVNALPNILILFDHPSFTKLLSLNHEIFKTVNLTWKAELKNQRKKESPEKDKIKYCTKLLNLFENLQNITLIKKEERIELIKIEDSSSQS